MPVCMCGIPPDELTVFTEHVTSAVFILTVDGNSNFVVVQAKNFGAFLISLSHISHPTYQQVMLGLPSKYTQKMTISHLLPCHNAGPNYRLLSQLLQ